MSRGCHIKVAAISNNPQFFEEKQHIKKNFIYKVTLFLIFDELSIIYFLSSQARFQHIHFYVNR